MPNRVAKSVWYDTGTSVVLICELDEDGRPLPPGQELDPYITSDSMSFVFESIVAQNQTAKIDDSTVLAMADISTSVALEYDTGDSAQLRMN